MREHNLNDAINLILRKRCKIKSRLIGEKNIKFIVITKPSEIGIKTWGVLDYLKYVHHYPVLIE